MTHVSSRAPVILVIGGTGFIAAHLLPKLVATGATVCATHRGRVAEVLGVRWVSGDLSSDDDIRAWPKRCDAVIYLAQARGWRDFPEGAAGVFEVNIGGVFRALEYARKAGVSHFVFVSSGSVYPAQAEPVRESDAIDMRAPRTFYAASKLAAEVLLSPYAALFKTVVLRLFVPYGSGQSPEMLLPRVADAVATGRVVTLHGESGLVMNPIAASDVADALIRCLSMQAPATFNLAGSEVVALRDVAERIGRIVGREPNFECQPGVAPSIVGDIGSLQEQLSWVPAIRLDAGLRQWLRGRAGPAGSRA